MAKKYVIKYGEEYLKDFKVFASWTIEIKKAKRFNGFKAANEFRKNHIRVTDGQFLKIEQIESEVKK